MARPDKLPRILTEEETKALLAQPNQRYFGPHRDYLFMRLMLKAGLRASEATALRPEHLDLVSGKLTVRDAPSGLGKTCSGNCKSGWTDAPSKPKARSFSSQRGKVRRSLPLTSVAR